MKLIQNKRNNKDKLQVMDELPPEQDNQIYQALCLKCGLITNTLIRTMLINKFYNICPRCSSKLIFHKKGEQKMSEQQALKYYNTGYRHGWSDNFYSQQQAKNINLYKFNHFYYCGYMIGANIEFKTKKGK